MTPPLTNTSASLTTRLDALRAQMRTLQIRAFLVPCTDEFQSEQPAPYARRLRWLTGFTGSAGLAVITLDAAALFVDSRYTLQAQQQVAPLGMHVIEGGTSHVINWLRTCLGEGAVGFDPWLHTQDQIAGYRNLTLQPVPQLVDLIWPDQPARPSRHLQVYSDIYAGQPYPEKLSDLRVRLQASGVDGIVLTDPTEICWLLNVRGTDVANVPVALVYALVFQDHVRIYGDAAQSLTHWTPDIQIAPFAAFKSDLARLQHKKLGCDPETLPWAVGNILQGANTLSPLPGICRHARALKNAIQQEGMRQCHIRDGVAVTQFLFWIHHNACPDEYAATQKLLNLRKQQPLFQGPSFDTIAGFGANGAIVHYCPTSESHSAMGGRGLLLLDSGGQYLDGTTDITRVLALGGDPLPDEISSYTAVLKGHIQLAQAVFPRGTMGLQLDALARTPIWQQGKDYGHGTGHGVGSYLSVHEGPQRISKGLSAPVALEPGMVLSNEPGYYETGAYGIRIESLMLVVEHPLWGPDFLSFETLTMAPLERSLIDAQALDASERAWVDEYHRHVADKLTPYLDPDTIAWLRTQTAPL